MQGVWGSIRASVARGIHRPDVADQQVADHGRRPGVDDQRVAVRSATSGAPGHEWRDLNVMHLEETAEQLALRAELRAYFAELLTDEVRARARRRERGRRGLPLPRPADGQGRLAGHRLAQGVRRPGPPDLRPVHLLHRGPAGPGPVPLRDPQHRRARCSCATAPRSRRASSCPGILAGEINFAIGYTEPEAGTDLASLRTRAVLDGDEWTINGNKIFTSGADQADYIWLATRTDPDAPKHKGISIFLVPTSAAGLLLHPDRHRGRGGHHRLVLRQRAGAHHGPGRRAATRDGA